MVDCFLVLADFGILTPFSRSKPEPKASISSTFREYLDVEIKDCWQHVRASQQVIGGLNEGLTLSGQSIAGVKTVLQTPYFFCLRRVFDVPSWILCVL